VTSPTFTILLPVHRPPALLPFAIASVQAQERQDFELFVICDGAPPETAAVARRHAAQDARIRVFEHPKGERHGELYRDQALRSAHGEFVCQIGDDDLWLPNHLGEMSVLLRTFDFGNVSQIFMLADGRIGMRHGDLAHAALRRKMCEERFNMFGPTVAGYRLAAYRSLPVGWSPAPTELPSDLYMWRKFLTRDNLRIGTRIAVSSVQFVASIRREWTLDQRAAEMASWAERLSDAQERDAFCQAVLRKMDRDADLTPAERIHQLERSEARVARLRGKHRAMRSTLSWRLTRPFRKLARLLR
jgi:glycosyltransferase involved in cell wall biosynthesis